MKLSLTIHQASEKPPKEGFYPILWDGKVMNVYWCEEFSWMITMPGTIISWADPISAKEWAKMMEDPNANPA